MIPKMKQKYREEIAPALREKHQYANVMMIPRLEKIVVNMGVGDANTEPRMLEAAMEELALITGQRPSSRIARKSISNFKLREGQKIGAMVTLRGDRMYEFLDRLFSVAIPRIRDFRGMPDKSFDKSFNYTMGIREQTVFPEIDSDKVPKVRGMNVTFVIRNSRSRQESYDLLEQFGLPFVRRN